MKKTEAQTTVRPSSGEPNKPLARTITRDFSKVPIMLPEDPVLSPVEKEARVLQLTSAARQLMKLGLSEPAFESLMKAYLIDPLSPQVLSCEKTVLPAWELTRKHGRVSDDPQKSDQARPRTLNAKPLPPTRGKIL